MTNFKIKNNELDDLKNSFNSMLTKLTTITTDKKSNDDNPFGYVDIITFCESPYYLNLKLYPWQELILKIFYMGSEGNRNLKINDSKIEKCSNCVWKNNELREHNRCLNCSIIPKEERQKIINELDESVFLEKKTLDKIRNQNPENNFCNEMMLIEKDLRNDSDARSGGSVKEQVLRKIGREFSELVLAIGRRSGKSLLVSIISLYETYKAIEMGNPQDFFGLNDGDVITILNVAVSEQQAKESVFDKIKPMITNSPYFKSKLSPGSLQNKSVKFLTDRDNEVNEQLSREGLPSRDGTIYLLSGHSNSDSLVGKNILVVIIDEMASMVGKDGSKMSDEELYIKLKNSIWTFKNRAKILCISNPLTRDGTFYELYERSFTDDRILMIQLPSYKVNPMLDEDALNAEKEAMEDPMHYLMQIEAQFAGGAAQPFIPSNFIDIAFDMGESMCRKEFGDPRFLYYMHLDPANNSDNYAMVILHVEEDPYSIDSAGARQKLIVVDHINMWTPTEEEPVSMIDVDNYVIQMARKFNIVSITYDQWNSAASNQLLQRTGLPSRITPFNAGYKQNVYTTLRNLFYQSRIIIYKNDSADENGNRLHGFSVEAADQLKFLQIRLNNRNFSVKATVGHYDDIPDCLAGAAHIALLGQHGYVSLPKSSLMHLSPFR